jgi:hypothetical protein
MSSSNYTVTSNTTTIQYLNIHDSVYFMIVTLSTVGYGDIAP